MNLIICLAFNNSFILQFLRKQSYISSTFSLFQYFVSAAQLRCTWLQLQLSDGPPQTNKNVSQSHFNQKLFILQLLCGGIGRERDKIVFVVVVVHRRRPRRLLPFFVIHFTSIFTVNIMTNIRAMPSIMAPIHGDNSEEGILIAGKAMPAMEENCMWGRKEGI